jgi:H+/Cl- antiporter ClcA
MRVDQISAFISRFSTRIKNDKIRNNFLQAIPFWTASLITGLIAVYYAKAFAWSESLCFSIIHTHKWYLFFLCPVCFVASWLIVKLGAINAKGSGIPQVMASIELATPRNNHLVEKLLSIKVMFVKILSSFLMILGGGAIGREGPTIQIAGCVFRKVNQLVPRSWPPISKKNMIMTGAAAGLAAAFNTPLGGIVFAVEELAKTHISYFKTALFTAVIIAGLTAQALLGPYLYLGYPDVSNVSNYMFFYVVLVAIVAGLAGSGISKLILKILNWKRGLKKMTHELLFVLVSGLIVSLIAYFFTIGILGSGKAQMSDMLFTSAKYGGWELTLSRIFGPLVSFTTGAAGGIFAPALSAGAAVGSLTAEIFHMANADANILILAGMVAFLTGVTRTPFTSAILVLEMTDRHNVIFHLMLAGMVASIVSMVIDKESLYERLKHQYLHDLRVDESQVEPLPE